MKILSSLNGTKRFRITFVQGSGVGLEVYADADYADKANDRRSVSGIAVTLEGTDVSHASKIQHLVSLSISEAEYIAAGDEVRVLFCLSLSPRQVRQAVRSLKTTRELMR